MRKHCHLRKRPVILLELIIAISLTLIILSTLTYFYHQVSYINREMDRTQAENFLKRYVESRLAAVIPRAVSSTDSSNDFHFFSSPDIGGLYKSGTSSLVFTFDNCVKLDKAMAYHVIGRLFVDEKGNLILAKWPVEKRWKENEMPSVAKEILLDNVEGLTFSFFIPPERRTVEVLNGVQPQEVEEGKALSSRFEIPAELKGRWVEEWKKEYHQLPAIVKMTIARKNDAGELEKINFAFPLPHTLNPIIYEE